MDNSSRISLAPLAELARAMSRRAGPDKTPDVDELLATLQRADRALDSEARALRKALDETKSALATARRERDDAVAETHGVRRILAARENAHAAQVALVKQLQGDNKRLNDSYQAAKRRADSLAKGSSDKEKSSDDKERPVSVSVKGFARDMRFSNAELVHVFEENERLQKAGADLIRTVANQKDAHEKLTKTVNDLMKQMEIGQKEQAEREKEWKRKVADLEKKVHRKEEECQDKDDKVAALKVEVNKVLAEYSAVSVAHEYSTAELAKLRQQTRGKKADRHERGGFGGVLGGVENLLHHRRDRS